MLVGVTGGIAAYKACELTRLLVRAEHDVIPLLTPAAERFVTRQTFSALARRALTDELFPHLANADLLVVAPCSANTLGKLAHGFADNVVTEAALAHRGATLVAPAMNPRMWAHPATQANALLLLERGVEIVGPAEGDTAEGEWGVGRMVEPEEIFERCTAALTRADELRGKRVLVSAGGTREPLDAVRFIGNRSSGRMGVALAAEAARRGADVTLLAANLAVPPPRGVEVIETPTASDVAREALARKADLVLMAAAVADYRPAESFPGKRAKDASPWHVELEPTLDVLQELGRARNGRVLVGFAADTGEDGVARARQKLRDKNADLIVLNDVSRADVGFDAKENEVVLVSAREERTVGKAPKEAIAAAVVDEAARILRAKSG